MKKYRNIILICILTIILSLITSLNIGKTITLIVCSVGITVIVILAKNTNKYEELIIQRISNVIHKILNVITIAIIIITIVINALQYKNITNTYTTISKHDYFKFNSIAIKELAIDIISTYDTVRYLSSNDSTKQGITEIYENTSTKTVFSQIKNIENNLDKVNILGIIKSTYWISKHFKDTRNICILTLLCYISIVYTIIRTKRKTV